MNPSTLLTLATTLALATGFPTLPLVAQAAERPNSVAQSVPVAQSAAVQQPQSHSRQLDIRLAQFEDFDFDDYEDTDRNNNRNNNGDRWNNSDREGNSDRWNNNNDRRNNGANRNDDDRWQDSDRWDRDSDRWDRGDNDDDRWNSNDRSNRNGCYQAYRNREGVSQRTEAELIAREFLGCRLGISPYSRSVQIVGIGNDRRNWVVRGKVDDEFFRIDIDADDAEVVNFDPPHGRNNNDDDDQDVIFF